MKKFTKSIVGILIFTMVSIGLATPVTYANSPSSWAQDTIKKANEYNLTTKRILSNYQQAITREEFAEVAVQLYSALGGTGQEQIKENPFIDTNNHTVLQAYNLGIISGKSSNKFVPNDPITRQELSVMLIRTIKALDSNFQTTSPRTISFIDQNDIAQWARVEVEYLYNQGIITGVEPLRIDPTGLTTREQAIVLVMRAYELFNKIIRKDNTLVLGQGADISSLDPHKTNDSPSSRVMKQIYDTLVYQNENMEIEPGLAESWKFIDETTIEFTLKKGAKFHNGEEFKASDVKFTLLRALESPYVGHIVGCIDPNRIKIIDDYKIRISTIEPFTPLLAHLAHTGASILNEKATKTAGYDYEINPIGTGPFKFKSWNMGETVELAKFNDYHGEKAKVEKIVFKNIPSAGNRFNELENEQIHIAYDIFSSDVKRTEEHKDLKLYRDTNLSTSYIGFNTQKKPLNDVRVRQAINYAIDVEPIIETAMNGIGKKANGSIGSNVWGSNQNLKPYEYNVEKAKKLLAEAGYTDGFKISIWTNDNMERIDIVEIVKSQLEAVNIDVEIEIIEWGTYLDATANGEHDMFILGWTTVTGDADYGLYWLFHSSQFGDGGNRQFYANEKVDELLDKGRIETNIEKRKEYYHEAQEIIRNDAPWIFLYNGENLTATRNNVNGFKQHPAGHHKLSGVYLEK